MRLASLLALLMVSISTSACGGNSSAGGASSTSSPQAGGAPIAAVHAACKDDTAIGTKISFDGAAFYEEVVIEGQTYQTYFLSKSPVKEPDRGCIDHVTCDRSINLADIRDALADADVQRVITAKESYVQMWSSSVRYNRSYWLGDARIGMVPKSAVDDPAMHYLYEDTKEAPPGLSRLCALIEAFDEQEHAVCVPKNP